MDMNAFFSGAALEGMSSFTSNTLGGHLLEVDVLTKTVMWVGFA